MIKEPQLMTHCIDEKEHLPKYSYWEIPGHWEVTQYWERIVKALLEPGRKNNSIFIIVPLKRKISTNCEKSV
jgi:hypothetical protein